MADFANTSLLCYDPGSCLLPITQAQRDSLQILLYSNLLGFLWMVVLMQEQVILVDDCDREIGVAEKLQAHLEASLHRAFSVFVFRDSGELLLQRRALAKYHSSGLWSNTCCGHPRPGELTLDAAHRRLREEMGFDCELDECFSFIYQQAVGNGLIEFECDHVFVGRSQAVPEPSPEEVFEWRWQSTEDVRREIDKHPERFTRWFPDALEKLDEHLRTIMSQRTS
jgi:isopentenyl-diphosphate Delta-isomerase